MAESDPKNLRGSSSGHDDGTFGSSSWEKFKADISAGKLAEALFHIVDQPSKFFEDIPFHVAVIEEPNAGKSSLIYTLQSPHLDEPDAAAADVATKIGIPDRIKAKLGQVKYSEITWNEEFRQAEDADGKEVDLKDFDCFITASQAALSHLTPNVQKMNKEIFLVQPKADLQQEEAKKQRTSKDNTDKFYNSIDSLKDWLREIGIKKPEDFPVSSKELQSYYSPDQLKFLTSDLLKKKILSDLDPVLESKADNMKKKSWLLTILSGFIAGIPFPGIAFLGGLATLIGFGSWCCRNFGVDDASLPKVAEVIEVALEDLKSMMTSPSKKKMVLQRLPDFLGASVMIAEYVYGKRFPFIGCILSVVITLISSFFTLKKLPSHAKEDTKKIVNYSFQMKEDRP